MVADIRTAVNAYVAAGGTARMTFGGLKRISELDTDAARSIWDTQIQPLFETSDLYEVLATLPTIVREVAPAGEMEAFADVGELDLGVSCIGEARAW